VLKQVAGTHMNRKLLTDREAPPALLASRSTSNKALNSADFLDATNCATAWPQCAVSTDANSTRQKFCKLLDASKFSDDPSVLIVFGEVAECLGSV